MKRILIAGGSGLIGTCLSDFLASKNYQVSWLSRNASPQAFPTFYWNPEKMELDSKALQNLDVLINLSGSSIGEGRWTSNRKTQILNSRIASIKTLKQHLSTLNIKIPLLIQASAIGYYGNCGDQTLNEDSDCCEPDFLSQTCARWEQEATQLKDYVENMSIIRTGLYLNTSGGVWPKLIQTKALRFLNYFGSGEQYYSWIHAQDYNRAIEFIIQNNASGIFNFTSPHAVKNRNLVKTICKLSKDTCICLPVPAFILKLILGEQANLLLNSAKVYPQNLLNSGFTFSNDTFEKAVTTLSLPKISGVKTQTTQQSQNQ
ncbi:MAG: TIGR01777 family protein [Saprospiraceae bacterium]|nr:TIGR01777 family protein [Saprospiraceae bacterium]MBK7738537.1 TIGR01777 family protein [Saprospiraceae bacterium]MBK7912891.1 TIGR01777 family protein [Saprospiraceae bacterium]